MGLNDKTPGTDSMDRTPAQSKNKAQAAAAKLIKETFTFMGRSYGFLRGVARNESVGNYTFDAARQERIAQIRGDEANMGQISRLEYLRDNIDAFVTKFLSINQEDLERMSKGGYSQSEVSDGGVTSTPPTLENPEDIYGGTT
jgi:hypothetical protein